MHARHAAWRNPAADTLGQREFVSALTSRQMPLREEFGIRLVLTNVLRVRHASRATFSTLWRWWMTRLWAGLVSR